MVLRIGYPSLDSVLRSINLTLLDARGNKMSFLKKLTKEFEGLSANLSDKRDRYGGGQHEYSGSRGTSATSATDSPAKCHIRRRPSVTETAASGGVPKPDPIHAR